VYAIVRSGGRQQRVAPDDIIEIDKIDGAVGDSIDLSPLLVVDGDQITSQADGLAGFKVSAEILGESKGPKIKIWKYKNKTGYKKRQGHRQQYTRVKITGIK
jgi:large subunit ribosomal protein L21